ncbi:hypothetical protein BX666DRAFT_2009917 [Dichotomocladium elegans]|nr:hypothetical protein BX666DRAFT_2009917 [Dichotomocladium elegans]
MDGSATPAAGGPVEDLTELSQLSEDALVTTIRTRFFHLRRTGQDQSIIFRHVFEK